MMQTGGHDLCLVEILYHDHARSYYFMRCPLADVKKLSAALQSLSDSIDLASFGTVLKSGWGATPEKWLVKYGIKAPKTGMPQ